MRWTDRLSLRTRLLIVLAALLAAALVVAGLLTVSALESRLRAQVDARLESVVDPPALNNLIVEVSTDLPRSPDALPSQFVVQLNRDTGQVSGPLMDGPLDHPLHLPYVTSAELGAASPQFRAVTDAGGRPWRALVTTVSYPDGGTGTAVIALPLHDVQAAVSSVVWRFSLAALTLIVILLAAGYFAIDRAFRPLRQVQVVAGAFGGGDTTRRVKVTAPASEVGRLGQSINDMLEQIETTLAARETSERRMRRFVGDAGHELRTPLAAVRGFAELYRMGAVTDPADVASTFRRIEEEATRMGTLVEDLLMLARLDAQRPLAAGEVDLLVLAADARHNAAVLAPDRTVTVTGLGGGPARPTRLTGDEARLRQVVTNLLTNAIRHTPPGTPVEVCVGVRDRAAVLQVVDHGPGIPPEVADRIFERFYRTDDSRSRESGGAGLGLAIVAAIVQAHGGTTRVHATAGGGATFVVTVPVRRDDTHSQLVPSFFPHHPQPTRVS